MLVRGATQNKQLDSARAVKVLLSSLSSAESSYPRDSSHIVEIIKAMQEDPDANLDDLLKVEWAYLGLLDHSWCFTEDPRKPIGL